MPPVCALLGRKERFCCTAGSAAVQRCLCSKTLTASCRSSRLTRFKPPAVVKYFVVFRLFTFLLDKNGQLNYNIDITKPKAWII